MIKPSPIVHLLIIFIFLFFTDAERIRRRRVDREKKFFEAESHRLKTLLTVSTGGIPIIYFYIARK